MPGRDTVELVDAAGTPAGECAKLAAHEAPGHLHRAFSVFLFSEPPDRRLLIQRRALGEIPLPGIWANTCCSHPAPGENVLESARRRLAEELGIGEPDGASPGELTVPGPIVEVGTFVYRAADPRSGRVEHEFDHVLVGTVTRADGRRPNEDDLPAVDRAEVEETRWLTVEDALTRPGSGGEGEFAPWFAEALTLAVASLQVDEPAVQASVGAEHELGSRSRGVPAPPEVRRVVSTDVGTVAAALARAFDDDPVSTYIFPDDQRRLAKLERFFRIQINRTFLRRGEGYTTPDLKGAAFWMTPTSGRPALWEVLQQVPLLPIVGTRLVPTMNLLSLLESHHPKQPHYYLGTIGTDPQWQGKGIGSAILQPVLDRCDAEGIPGYLESSKESNLPFYRRHGFEVSGEISVSEGPRLWLMWREPLGRPFLS